MNNNLSFMLAILTGVFTTLEAAVTTGLSKFTTPKIATLHNFIISTLIMFIINLTNGTLSQYSKIINVPLKWSIGGLFGALAIYFLTIIIPRLGVTITFTIVITFQIISSFFIDTFMLKQQFELIQIIGFTLIIKGLYLVMR